MKEDPKQRLELFILDCVTKEGRYAKKSNYEPGYFCPVLSYELNKQPDCKWARGDITILENGYVIKYKCTRKDGKK